MKLDEMISRLTELRDAHGNLEVLVTDGHNCACYRGDYDITIWQDDDGKWCADIISALS